MADIEKVIKGLECHYKDGCTRCPYDGIESDTTCGALLCNDALELLKELKSSLGIQLTADSITFISTGTAQQGESRGILLGKYAMHEWLEKELLYRGLLTDDIRAVFDEAKRQ